VEEAALAIIVLWGLPWLGIKIPLAGLIILILAWLAFSVFSYHMGSRALRKPIVAPPNMVGKRGKVVSPLAPEGLVRIDGELWIANSDGETIDAGNEVVVVAQDGLKLVVHAAESGGDS
jgi:membrane protein implicated in regulation of membrane protease activity